MHQVLWGDMNARKKRNGFHVEERYLNSICWRRRSSRDLELAFLDRMV